MADVSVHVFGTSRGYASCQRDTPRPIPRANINRVARLRRIFSGRHARRGGNVEPRAARFSESCRDLAIILRGSNLFIYLFLKIARCPAVPSDLNTSRYVPPPPLLQLRFVLPRQKRFIEVSSRDEISGRHGHSRVYPRTSSGCLSRAHRDSP